MGPAPASGASGEVLPQMLVGRWAAHISPRPVLEARLQRSCAFCSGPHTPREPPSQSCCGDLDVALQVPRGREPKGDTPTGCSPGKGAPEEQPWSLKVP